MRSGARARARARQPSGVISPGAPGPLQARTLHTRALAGPAPPSSATPAPIAQAAIAPIAPPATIAPRPAPLPVGEADAVAEGARGVVGERGGRCCAPPAARATPLRQSAPARSPRAHAQNAFVLMGRASVPRSPRAAPPAPPPTVCAILSDRVIPWKPLSERFAASNRIEKMRNVVFNGIVPPFSRYFLPSWQQRHVPVQSFRQSNHTLMAARWCGGTRRCRGEREQRAMHQSASCTLKVSHARVMVTRVRARGGWMGGVKRGEEGKGS